MVIWEGFSWREYIKLNNRRKWDRMIFDWDCVQCTHCAYVMVFIIFVLYRYILFLRPFMSQLQRTCKLMYFLQQGSVMSFSLSMAYNSTFLLFLWTHSTLIKNTYYFASHFQMGGMMARIIQMWDEYAWRASGLNGIFP